MDAATARAAAAVWPGGLDAGRGDLAAQLLGRVVPARRRAAAGDLLCYHRAAPEPSRKHALEAGFLGVRAARRRPTGGGCDRDISLITRVPCRWGSGRRSLPEIYHFPLAA